jgi:hypothetical protein
MAMTRNDPPTRPGWIRMMKPDQHRTALLRQYVEIRMGCKDADEATKCRSFLKSYSKATSDGNPCGIELAIRGTSVNDMVAIFAIVPGVGAVSWLPVLLTKRSDRLVHIIRETGDRMFPVEPPKKEIDPWDEPEKRRSIPPKVVTQLIPGRKS